VLPALYELECFQEVVSDRSHGSRRGLGYLRPTSTRPSPRCLLEASSYQASCTPILAGAVEYQRSSAFSFLSLSFSTFLIFHGRKTQPPTSFCFFFLFCVLPHRRIIRQLPSLIFHTAMSKPEGSQRACTNVALQTAAANCFRYNRPESSATHQRRDVWLNRVG
jgi:hypothetical protein